jgi:uncharacterized membrane protein
MDSRDGCKPAMTDEKLQVIIGNLLRAGVTLSAIIVSLAGIAYLAQHYDERVTYATFHLERSNLRNVIGIVRSAMRLRADAIIQFGLVILIATPIARVALAVIGFYYERDRLYVAVSLIVLSILLFSVLRAV